MVMILLLLSVTTLTPFECVVVIIAIMLLPLFNYFAPR